MKPPLIQYWHTETPPGEVAELLDSIERCNPDMRHLLFDEAEAERFIASHYTDREVAAFRACAVPAMQADYFRYCAVLALGGFYVDADFRGVASLHSLFGAVGGTLFGRNEVPHGWSPDIFGAGERVGPYRLLANSIFFFAAPEHPLLRLALEVATASIESRIAEDVAVTTGPGIFTSVYLLDRLGSFDAFLDYAAGGILRPSADLFCEVVGNQERVVAALDGVRMLPFADSRSAVRETRGQLAYKSTDAHWVNHRGSIFKA